MDPVNLRRRLVLFLAGTSYLPWSRDTNAFARCASPPDPKEAKDSEAYVDEDLRFRLVPPSRWQKTSLAGADASFVDVEPEGSACRSRRADVIVRKVKVARTSDLGDAQGVAKQLLAAEAARRSDAPPPELVDVDVTIGTEDGSKPTYYDVECLLVGARGGPKRQFTRLAVYRGLLYSITVAVPEQDVSQHEGYAATIRKAARSFEVIN